MRVEATDDPSHVLDQARDLLRSRPVAHNLMLTLLHDRVAHPRPGRYWITRGGKQGDQVVGVTFQSPFRFPATLTPMSADAVEATVDAIAAADVDLPGVNAEAATAARFAGHWTDRRPVGAVPEVGQRIYELDGLRLPEGVAGDQRPAEKPDRGLVLRWTTAFLDDVGEPGPDPEEAVDRRLPLGQFLLWEQEGAPCSMAARTTAVEGVVRVQLVYTPPEHRGHGYAAANVAELCRRLVTDGHRCILFTDLGNPTSNGVYRRIGFRAHSEGIRYRFVA